MVFKDIFFPRGMQRNFPDQWFNPDQLDSSVDRPSSKGDPKGHQRWGYRPEIDGLRAIAVLAVIINHFNPDSLPSRFLGVDIFFVISGFVVTASLQGKPDQRAQTYLLSFYARRVKRLMPALVICVTLTSLVGCFCIPPQAKELQPSLLTGMASLVGVSNLYLLHQSTDYFGAAANFNLFTQTWSLGVEEQFYLLFPGLLVLCGFNRTPHKQGSRHLFLAALGLSVVSLITYVNLAQANASATFFLMPTRFWELGLGCLAFLASHRLANPRWVGPKRILAPIGGLTLVATLFVSQSFQLETTLAIAALSAVMLLSLDGNRAIVKLLSWPWLVRLGLLSYSLYLWHWSVLVISRWTVGVQRETVAFQVLLIIGLAVGSYHYIETPLRRRVWSPKPPNTIGYGLTSCLISLFILYGLALPLQGKLYVLGIEEVPPNWWLSKDGQYIEVCHPEAAFDPHILDACLTKASDSSKRSILLLGDSHGRNILKGLEAAFTDWNVNYATMGHGCAFVPVEMIQPKIDRKVNCAGYINGVLEFIESPNGLKPGDVIIIGNLIAHIQRGQPDNWKIFEEEMAEIAQKLKKKQVSLIMAGDVPGLPVHVSHCLKNKLKKEENAICKTPIAASRQKQTKLREIADSLATGQDNFYFLNYHDQLCDQDICSAYLGDQIIYVDRSHLSDKASQQLGPFIRDWAESSGLMSPP